jgi:L-arabinonolactonase
VCCAGAEGEDFQSYAMPELVGSIGLAEGGLIAALRDGFYFVDLDGEAGATAIARPERDNGSVRFNDGKADRQGRFLAGTMRAGDVTGTPGILYRLELDGHCTVLQHDIAVSNALCFSPKGDRLYFADSVRSLIWCSDYEAATGQVSGRRAFIDTRAWGSVPDGATVDASGDLWITLFQVQKLAQCSGDGRLKRLIELPVPYPSCPAFGGPDLRTLYVTTIANSGYRIRSDHSDAGRMMVLADLDAHGLAEARYRAAPAGSGSNVGFS